MEVKLVDMAIEGPNADFRFVEDITEEFTGTFDCRLGKTLYCQESDARENFGDLLKLDYDGHIVTCLAIDTTFTYSVNASVLLYMGQFPVP